jgi:hypothetical protein
MMPRPVEGIFSERDIIKFLRENPSYQKKPLSAAIKLDVSWKRVVGALRKMKVLRDDNDTFNTGREYHKE